MRRRLIIILVLLVVGPLLLLTRLGLMWARLQQERLRNQFRELLLTNLREHDAKIGGLIQTRERQLIELTRKAPADPRELESFPDQNPWVRQAFLLDREGRLIYPKLEAATAAELEFIARTREVLWRRDFPPRLAQTGSQANPANAYAFATNAASPQVVLQSPAPMTSTTGATHTFANAGALNAPADPPSNGWYTWYLGSGLNFVYWSRLADGRALCIELDRVRMLADIIAQLPATAIQADAPGGRIMLRDSNGALLYQWGAYDRDLKTPLATLPLSPPLQSWRLDYYAPPKLYGGVRGGLMFGYLASLSAIAVMLITLAFYFYRESTRDMRLARQRVSFVNQVSHELKTPLTNVRLYAELLQQHLDGEDETAQRHLAIVVEECGRLSRLIGNVLTFGRSQRGTLAIRPAPGRVGEIVQRVLEGYRPALKRRGIEVHFSTGADEPVMVAADVVEQIIGNLLSNIEKYAAGGGLAEIRSEQRDGTTRITVSDRGPGIPAAERENIFKPFYRISSALNDGAAGTGIGLAIARELARGHGGDLKVVDDTQGATFEVTLKTPMPRT